jgi:hypothetical protein
MPMSKGFRSRKRIGNLADSTAVAKRRGVHEFYPGSAPRRVKTYILLVWSCIASICGAVTKVRRCNLAEVEGDGVASLCQFRCSLCEIGCLGGHPWWLYKCSQLGFISSYFFYSKSKCWALQASCILRAGFFLGGNRVGKYRGPRGHTLVSSPRVPGIVEDYGRDSNPRSSLTS